MANDMKRIKTALANQVLVSACIARAKDYNGVGAVAATFGNDALHAAILSLIRETREECAREAEQHSSSGGEGDPVAESNSIGYNTAVETIAAAIRALNEEDKHGD
jgi:hypothetical protein